MVSFLFVMWILFLGVLLYLLAIAFERVFNHADYQPICPACGSRYVEKTGDPETWCCRENGHEFKAEACPPAGRRGQSSKGKV